MCQLNKEVGQKFIDKKSPLEAFRWFAVNSNGTLAPVNNKHLKTWHRKTARSNKKPVSSVLIQNDGTEAYNSFANASGLYCYKTKELAKADEPRYGMPYVLAKILIWGDCAEHIDGYRAASAQVVELYPTKNSNPKRSITKKVKKVYYATQLIAVKTDFVKDFKKNAALPHVKIVDRRRKAK